MKKVYALLGVCAALGAFCVPAPAQAAPAIEDQAIWGENFIWGEILTEQAIWGDIILPAGTLMGYSVASANSVYVWALVPGASGPILLEEKLIWGN
jgi:hypothetical protein